MSFGWDPARLEQFGRSDIMRIPGERTAFKTWLGDNGVTGSELQDWVLVYSELVANAHQNGVPSTDVSVRSTCSPQVVDLSVTNITDGRAVAPTVAVPADASLARGRGLSIVTRLTDGLEFAANGSILEARCWRRRSG